jgi:hypothetical protein
MRKPIHVVNMKLTQAQFEAARDILTTYQLKRYSYDGNSVST